MRRLDERTVCIGAFILSVLLNLGFSSIGLRNSLLEIHEFRQLQTAYSTRYIQSDGFSLAYPTPLFGPPWSAPMEFPLYQVCVAQFVKLTGLPLEPAGRLVSLAFLYAGLPAWFGLAGLLALPRHRRWLLLSLILLSPAYLYYSRSFLIESTALCVSAWFLLSYCKALQLRSRGWLAAAVAFGIAAALTKVTTLIVFLVVAAAYTMHLLWKDARDPTTRPRILGTLAFALAATIPAVAVGAAWVHFADAVKLSNPLTADLVSANLWTFNFGTWHQRLSGQFWNRMFAHTSMAVAPAINVAFVVVFALVLGRSTRLLASLLLLGFVAGPMIFANLYFVHDYYFYASGVFLLGALYLAWNQLLDLPTFSVAARWTVIALSIGVQLGSYFGGYQRAQLYNEQAAPELARILAATTDADDVILVFGQDWDSRIPYFAQRRAIMVTDRKAQNLDSVHAVLDRIDPDSVTALVVTGQLRGSPGTFKPFTERLHLTSTPVLASEDTMVYLADRDLVSAMSRLEISQLHSFNIAETTVMDSGNEMVRRRSVASTIDPRIIDMLSPRPVIVVHPFGLSINQHNGRNVLNAHAPTDVLFNRPPQAKEVVAEFGMDPASYDPKNHTDGVEFRVELVTEAGVHRTLHSVYLSPTERPIDRGEKTMRVELPADEEGQIWFRTLAGPKGSIACDWAYWASIEFK